MKKIMTILAALLVAVSAVGQEKRFEQKESTTGLEKGMYVNIELSTDISYNKYAKDLNPNYVMDFGYDITLALGYRFCPQFTLAAGLGGGTNVNYWDLSLPVFLRLRTDILDKRVSPYIQLDLGYSFFIPNRSLNTYYSNMPKYQTLDSELNWKYNGSSRDKYIYDYINNHRNLYYNSLSGKKKYDWEQKMEEKAVNELNRFSSGDSRYVNVKATNLTSGKSGLFGIVTLGASWKVGGHSRMSAGVATGLMQYTLGQFARTNDLNTNSLNEKLWCAGIDYLPGKNKDRPSAETIDYSGYRYNANGDKEEFDCSDLKCDISRGQIVLAVGEMPFWKRFKPFGQIKIGFSF